MKFSFTILIMIFSISIFARTRSFLTHETELAFKTIQNKTFEIQGNSAVIIKKYDTLKLALIQTKYNVEDTVTVKGLTSLLVHSIKHDYAYALFNDEANILPEDTSNDLFSYLENNDIRSMNFKTITPKPTIELLAKDIQPQSNQLFVIINTDLKIKDTPIDIKLSKCDDDLKIKNNRNFLIVTANPKKSCNIEYQLKSHKSLHVFHISNDIISVANDLIDTTRLIIKNYKTKIINEKNRKKVDNNKLKELYNQLKKQEDDLKALKKLTKRLDDDDE